MRQKTTLFTKASMTLFAVFFSFVGARAQQALPYEYGFEDNDLSIDGWVLQGATSSNTRIETETNAAHNGTHGFVFYYSEQNAYLISPLLTGGENGVKVSFYYGEYSNQYGDEQFQVGYTTDESVTDASEFTYGDVVTASTSWQEYTGYFPAGTKRIAIKYIFNDTFYFYLDDFKFTTIPLVYNATATPTATTATISWEGSADSYEVKYRTPQTSSAPSFFEDFENGLDDWTIYTKGTAPKEIGWYTYDPTGGLSFGAHSGASCASSWSWSGDAYNANNWLITPKVTFNKQLKFWVRTNSSWPDSYEVLLSTTGNAEEDFTVTLQALAPAPAVTEWTEVIIDLRPYEGQEGYIAFHHADNDMNYLLIDDLGLYSEDIPASEWTTVTTTGTSIEISGLTPKTKYEYIITAIKDGAPSDETEIATFTTTAANPIPYDIAADLAADGATFTWKGEGDSYNVQYRTAESRETYYFNDFNDQDVTGWTYSGSYIYGIADPIYNVAGSSNYFLSMGWSSTEEETIISSELPAYESGARVEFYYFGYNTANTFQVGFSTTTNDADAFTWSDPIEAPLTTYTLYNEELAAGVKYVAFKATASEQGACIFIDDFGIFSPTTPASAWQTVATAETAATISGLATNKTYEYQIQSIKEGEDASEWSELGEFSLVTLDCEGDNSDLIKMFDGKFAHVTLANRTFFQDGTWNTICLPFDLDPDQIAASPLADADVRLFEGSSVNDNTVTLNFTEEGEALGYFSRYDYPGYVGGMPYIVKWASGTGIENAAFANVTITNYQYSWGDTSGDVQITFNGLYDKYEFASDNTSFLFVGADNKLNYPLAGATIGATRGYFALTGVTAGEGSGAKQFIMNFGDEDPTAIANISNVKESSEWYDLNGRKLASKPSMKGIYVNGGRKVAIK